MSSLSFHPFRLPLKNRFLARCIEHLLGLNILARCYDGAPKDRGTLPFLDHVLDTLGVDLETVDHDNALSLAPTSGPLLVVANHPLGGLEGVAIAKLLLELRPDVRVLTNQLLTRIPELNDIFIGVDVLSGNASQQNMRGLREATQHLRGGGALLIFPAGKVAQVDIAFRRIYDHPWHRLVGQLARKTGATCLPIHVGGYNSRLFYVLALIHPRLRTLLLPRELANKQGRTLRLAVGKPVVSQEIRHLGSASAVTDYLRISTQLLGKQPQEDRYAPEPRALSLESSLPFPAELATLADCKLLESEAFAVYCAPYARLGSLLSHIGVAREVTFRQVGEGTGNSIDTDHFDPHYEHLFIWDNDAHRLVGGYRIGRTLDIVEKHGLDALYSRTLYDFDRSYLDKIGQPLEMGRSFIHPDYQRHPLVLDLLWRGIGRYVAKKPQFHTLFGAVSISREHSDLARALIEECMLESFCAEQRFLDDVRPVAPLRVSGKLWTREMLTSLTHISVVNKLVGRCDPGKALPTLLRHYLSLNGRFVCFSLNKVFNDSLDGLILVDLRETPKKYLKRYLGKDGAANFLAYHGVDRSK